MRTTIIPAQITTVEDKIAGTLNMTQILILMFPILWTAIMYILLAPSMKLVPYKLLLILGVTILCFILSLRIKEKIVAEWLGILIAYRIRPKFYLFNKNDLTGRTVDIPTLPTEVVLTKKTAKKISKTKDQAVSLSDIVKLEHLIESGKVALRYQVGAKRI